MSLSCAHLQGVVDQDGAVILDIEHDALSTLDAAGAFVRDRLRQGGVGTGWSGRASVTKGSGREANDGILFGRDRPERTRLRLPVAFCRILRTTLRCIAILEVSDSWHGRGERRSPDLGTRESIWQASRRSAGPRPRPAPIEARFPLGHRANSSSPWQAAVRAKPPNPRPFGRKACL
jgi:hypothetical protein